ncbi:HET-domain-containing protein [Nemania sp. FL0916]|nr:HET-domain-containing protein [Nemania sp. FL0916]
MAPVPDASSSWTTDEDGIKVPPLLPVPSDIAKPGDELCAICKTIDFEPSAFFRHRGSDEDDDSADADDEDEDEDDEGEDEDSDEEEEEEESDEDSIALSNDNILGAITDVRKRVHCPFCRLALRAVGGSRVPDTKGGSPVSVEIQVIKNGAAPRMSPTRVLMPSVEAPGAYIDEQAVFPEIVVLANDAPPSGGRESLVRVVNREKIDFDMVANWLDICESVHGDECRKKPGMDEFPVHPATILQEFRLIDVNRGCLVRAGEGDKYTALSYVWGTATVLRTVMANVESLEQPGAFDTPEIQGRLALTVKDAIQATREIGIPYLWVDALCIVQDDVHGEKLPHIKQMNRIYEMAELVIVARSGRDANAGLPGVRPWTRDAVQPIEQMTPQLRLAVRTIYGNDSADCAYETRGWTYQETAFARRQLVFAGGQVIFLCNFAGNWSEDRVIENDETVRAEMLDGGNAGNWNGDDDISSYEGQVQNYSSRVLTYESDIYAAFAGVSQRMRELMNTDLCHGIPPRYFDWCLLWDPMNAQTRRQGTASWSWAGWTGGVFPHIWGWYNRNTRNIQKALKVRTWIIWYHRVAHDSTNCQLVWDWNAGSKRKRDSRNFYGGEIRSRFSIDCSQTRPTERTLTTAPTYYPDILCDNPGSGFLQFWTVSIEFRLDHHEPSEEDGRNSWFGGHTQLGIFGRNGRELGTIQVSDTWLGKRSLPLTGEFIILCEGRDKSADNHHFDDEEPGWKYKVMLLEWHDEYAERVAVGSINKGDEREGEPVWKEIILG